MMGNGTGPAGSFPERDAYASDALTSSGEVQEWLESAWKWFVAQGDLSSARALLAIIEALSEQRSMLLDQMLTAAEMEAAKEMVSGGS